MTASHADLLSVGEERVLAGKQGPSAISSGVFPRERRLDRRSQVTSGGRLDRDRTASLADEGGASAVRFEARGVAPDEAAAEENQMRLLAALLALGALLVWVVFLQG